MRTKTILLICIALVVGCKGPPSAAVLGAKYTNSPMAFEELRGLIQADTPEKECFVVGTDNIGRYWKHGDSWTRISDYQRKLSLPEVLKAVGLSQERYDKYLRLFIATTSERITHCREEGFEPWVAVLVYRAGLGVSGCSGTLHWSQDTPPLPTGKRGEGDFAEISPLQNGWYAKLDCT